MKMLVRTGGGQYRGSDTELFTGADGHGEMTVGR